MISYELAKELHDAGFPHEGSGTRIAPPDMIVARRHDFVYVPTLEELIDACLPDTYGFKLVKHPDYWSALTSRDGASIADVGASPIEALARLWLMLNRN